LDDGRPSAKITPQMASNRVQIQAIRWTKVNCRFSRCKFLRFWQCEREHRPAALTTKLTATSHLDVG